MSIEEVEERLRLGPVKGSQMLMNLIFKLVTFFLLQIHVSL